MTCILCQTLRCHDHCMNMLYHLSEQRNNSRRFELRIGKVTYWLAPSLKKVVRNPVDICELAVNFVQSILAHWDHLWLNNNSFKRQLKSKFELSSEAFGGRYTTAVFKWTPFSTSISANRHSQLSKEWLDNSLHLYVFFTASNTPPTVQQCLSCLKTVNFEYPEQCIQCLLFKTEY